MRNWALSSVLVLGLSAHANAETLVVGAWNIANLHHEDGLSMFAWGTSRTEEDYILLRQYSEMFGRDETAADIVALQEIGTLQAAERIFPAPEYEIIMSSRYDAEAADAGEHDIFTAVAVRTDSGVSVLAQNDLDGLIVFDADGNPTRAGTAVLMEYEDEQFWFVSVHLKSSCAGDRVLEGSSDEDCRMLWQQTGPLQQWISERVDDGVPFIIAGDFNRRFRQLQFEGEFWTAINGGDVNEPALVAHPESVTRRCATRIGNSVEPIDWFLLDARVADWFVEGSFWERRFTRDDIAASRQDDGVMGLSDHCPISVEIDVQ